MAFAWQHHRRQGRPGRQALGQWRAFGGAGHPGGWLAAPEL